MCYTGKSTNMADSVDVTQKKKFKFEFVHSYKLIIIVVLIFIFLNSDFFVNGALAQISGAVDYYPTTYGTFLQAGAGGLLYMIADVLVNNEIL